VARLDRLVGRLGARRARLLGAEGLRALGARGATEARLSALRQGPWAGAIPADGPLPPPDALEARLRALLREEAELLLGEVEGAAARRVLAAFLALDEAATVKALLRGVVAGAPPGRILAAAPPGPGLSTGLLQRAAGAADVEGVVAALEAGGHPLAATLREALPRRDHDGLLPLEAAIDRAAFLRAAAAAGARGAGEDGRVLREHLEHLADAANAALLLALAGAGPRRAEEVAPLVRPGGRRLAEAEVLRLAGGPAGEARAAVARAFPAVAAGGAPWADDLALERSVLAGARRAARARPLSAAVVIAYLLDRRAEARRLALLLRGTALELPADELLPLLEMGGAP